MLVGFWCVFKLQECKRRGLKVVVAGIPKTIDNDIEVSGPSTY
jgi:6-phosphofructokinase